MTASLVFIITYAWVLSSDETGALVWLSDWACACRDWLLPPMVALPHACLPVRWWIRFAAAKPRWLKQPTGLFLRATFRIHNHLPPKQKKDIPFGMSFCFGGRWWIRTTEVIDDRFTVWSIPAECLMISGVFPYYSLVHCFIPLTTIVLFDSFHLFSDLFSKTLLLIYCLFIAFRERI